MVSHHQGQLSPPVPHSPGEEGGEWEIPRRVKIVGCLFLPAPTSQGNPVGMGEAVTGRGCSVPLLPTVLLTNGGSPSAGRARLGPEPAAPSPGLSGETTGTCSCLQTRGPSLSSLLPGRREDRQPWRPGPSRSLSIRFFFPPLSVTLRGCYYFGTRD